MEFSASEILKLVPPQCGVSANTARYWLKTGLFGAAQPVGGGGGPGNPLRLDDRGAAVFLVAAHLYAFGISGAAFEQLAITIGRELSERWPRWPHDLLEEMPVLDQQNGEGARLTIFVMGLLDDGSQLYGVHDDWGARQGPDAPHGASLVLDLSKLLRPLVQKLAGRT